MVFRAGDFSQGISAFMAGATLWKQQGMCRQKKKKKSTSPGGERQVACFPGHVVVS